jgi:hypothetical protein
MSDAPERIWIDAWGGNWSPVSGGTQEIEYIRADRIEALRDRAEKPEAALEEALREAAWVIPDRGGFDADKLDAAIRAMNLKQGGE